MIETSRKYQFSWELLGDLQVGRPNLGNSTRIEPYRLMQYCLRDVAEKHFGTHEADRLFYQAGKLAGKEFYKNVINSATDFNQLASLLQNSFREMGIGILRIEKADLEKGLLTITVSEDLDCSGLPELDYEICTYDEGFISGLLETYSGKSFEVKEIDCWCTGDRTCRFEARLVGTQA